MKKICLISDKNIYMKRICNFLVENNYDVHLICRHAGGLAETEFHESIKFYQLSSNKVLTKYREIHKVINRIKPNIVHMHFITKDAFIPAFRLNKKYKFYITIWGSDINIHAQKRFNRLFQNLGLILCDKIHLLSPYFVKQIKKTFFGIKQNKIISYSWGIDVDSFQNFSDDSILKLKTEFKLSDKNPVILNYRNHRPLYNHHITIQAMSKVLARYPQAKFIFTRSGCDENYLQSNLELVTQKKLRDNFIFIDRWLSDEELRGLVNLANITISIPSRDGLPATLLEIMATKSIPIVSDLKNYHPFFEHDRNGFYLNQNFNHAQLADLIIEALDDRESLVKRFHKNNLEYVRHFQDWKIQKKKLLAFYREKH